MDGIDKGLIEIAGQPLVGWVASALRPQVSTLLISANRNRERYAALGWPVLKDQYDDHQGPLAGIAAALAHIRTPWLLVSPCDTPLIPADLARRLAATLGARAANIAIAADNARTHPLHALIPRTAGVTLCDYLAGGARSVTGWLECQRTAVAIFDEMPGLFENLNRPSDVASLRERLELRQREP